MKSKLKRWKKIRTRVIARNPYLQLDEDVVELPTGEKRKYFISNRNHAAVIILATDGKQRVLIQKEYRYPVNRVVNEFPSGMKEKGETPLYAAKREFQEEAGFKAKHWMKLGTFYASPSRTDLQFHAYHASQLSFIGTQPDSGEFIEHEWVDIPRLRVMVKNGTIKTQSVLATLYLYFRT